MSTEIDARKLEALTTANRIASLERYKRLAMRRKPFNFILAQLGVMILIGYYVYTRALPVETYLSFLALVVALGLSAFDAHSRMDAICKWIYILNEPKDLDR